MKFSVYQLSRQGGRKKNEDRMGYCYTRSSALFLLADGMGGHPDGEVAAHLALQSIAALFEKQALPELPDVAAFLNQALLAAHRQIVRYGTDRAMLDSPRTTIVAAVVQSGHLSWTHCGDSRLYLLRHGELLARTRDHSLTEHKLAYPGKTGEAARSNRNILFTCLGSPTKPVFSVTGPAALQPGDRVMLCSDGLWSCVADKDIIFELSHKPVDAAVPELVEKAVRQGGASGDNITCIALEWQSPGSVASAQDNSSNASAMQHADFFASTMQSDDVADPVEGLDDAQIERSIAEINAAIHRSAVKKI